MNENSAAQSSVYGGSINGEPEHKISDGDGLPRRAGAGDQRRPASHYAVSRGNDRRGADDRSKRRRYVRSVRPQKEDWSKQAAVEIERALGRLDKWPLKRLTTKSIRSGLKAARKKARRALALARRSATDANLHELRKTVKDLWYDLRLLGGDRPPQIETLTKRLRDLGQKLGDDHDLAMLLAARADNPLPDPADWETLEKANNLRRPRLQRTALRLASRALIRKPEAFAHFVVGRWERWKILEI